MLTYIHQIILQLTIKLSYLKHNQATQNDCENILYLIRNHRIPYMSPVWIVNS